MAVGLGEGLRNVKSVRRRTFGTSNKPDSLKKSGMHLVHLLLTSFVSFIYHFDHTIKGVEPNLTYAVRLA